MLFFQRPNHFSARNRFVRQKKTINKYHLGLYGRRSNLVASRDAAWPLLWMDRLSCIAFTGRFLDGNLSEISGYIFIFDGKLIEFLLLL